YCQYTAAIRRRQFADPIPSVTLPLFILPVQHRQGDLPPWHARAAIDLRLDPALQGIDHLLQDQGEGARALSPQLALDHQQVRGEGGLSILVVDIGEEDGIDQPGLVLEGDENDRDAAPGRWA